MIQDPASVARAQELRVAIGRVARRMRQLYAVERGEAASFTEVAVLVRLERDGPCSPTELAGRERVTSQAIAAVVRELERRALISRARAAGDGRRVVVTITEAGRRVLRDREQTVMDALIRSLGHHFSAREREQLQRAAPLLERLADRL